MEDFAGLFRGAGRAFADEVEEAGDVLEAGAGRGVGAEEAGVSYGRINNALKSDITARSF